MSRANTGFTILDRRRASNARTCRNCCLIMQYGRILGSDDQLPLPGSALSRSDAICRSMDQTVAGPRASAVHSRNPAQSRRLAPYRAERNPMEIVWDYLRRNKRCSTVWDSDNETIGAGKAASSTTPPSFYSAISTNTGTWSEVCGQSRASFRMAWRWSLPWRSGVAQIWSSLRPRLDSRQSRLR